MQGLEILSKTPIMELTSQGLEYIIALVMLVFIFLILTFVTTVYGSNLKYIFVCLMMIIMFIIPIVGNNNQQETGRYRYEVQIMDDKILEFYDNYRIVQHDNDVLIIEDKEYDNNAN